MRAGWDFVDGTVPQTLRKRVLLAALDELTCWGVERFDVGAMAARHGLDEACIDRYWGTRQRLLLDVMFYDADEVVVPPDTGSLRTDLEAIALSLARHLNTMMGRRLLRALVIDEHAQHPDPTRVIYWRRRYEAIRTILDKAAVRGELSEGVRPMAGVQILLSSISVHGLYTDTPIDEAYCLDVAELAWRALARR